MAAQCPILRVIGSGMCNQHWIFDFNKRSSPNRTNRKLHAWHTRDREARAVRTTLCGSDVGAMKVLSRSMAAKTFIVRASIGSDRVTDHQT